MLKTRLVTALLLIAAFLPALFLLAPLPWAWLVAAIAGLAAWEWGGLMRLAQGGRIALGLTAFAAVAGGIVFFPAALGSASDVEAGRAAMWQLGRWLYLPAAAFWLLALPLWLRQRWPLPGRIGGLAIGALVLLPACLALIQLRTLGPTTLLAVLAIVWLADVAAYFAGRRFGKRKLAPQISPGKTWAGAWGALTGVLIYGYLIADFLPPQFGAAGKPGLLLILALCTALSIVGDLFESLLKRQAGIKDSSQLLPGHGGVLDRIDSQTAVLPLVALLWLV